MNDEIILVNELKKCMHIHTNFGIERFPFLSLIRIPIKCFCRNAPMGNTILVVYGQMPAALIPA